MPPAVAFVLELHPPHVGGVETLFDQLCRGLAAAGHRVTVVTSRLNGTPPTEDRDGVTVVRVWVPPVGRRYWFALLAVPAATRAAAAADLVHTTTYTAALAGWVAAWRAGKPAVVTAHEVFGDQWQRLPGLPAAVGFVLRAFEWGVLRLPFDRYVCDSAFTGRRLRRFVRVPARATTVIYPPVDTAFWRPGVHAARPLRADLGLPPECRVYLYFGRPGVSKGVGDLLAAAERVWKAAPDTRLVMLLARSPAGGHARAVGQVVDRGLAGHVRILDPVPRADLPGYLLAADAVVVPSRSEGFGYAAAEAARLGCRVVATAGHAVEEVLGKAVHLAPPADPAGLAAAILRALDSPPPTGPVPDLAGPADYLAAVTEVYRHVLAAGRRRR